MVAFLVGLYVGAVVGERVRIPEGALMRKSFILNEGFLQEKFQTNAVAFFVFETRKAYVTSHKVNEHQRDWVFGW